MLPTVDYTCQLLTTHGETLSIMESCTGGVMCAEATERAGASRYFKAGSVAYANEEKTRVAGVPLELFVAHGAVSEPVARAMADGMRERTGSTYALGVTGISGPGGGTPEKPVGTVWIALATPDGTQAKKYCFEVEGEQTREEYRYKTTRAAYRLLLECLNLRHPEEP